MQTEAPPIADAVLSQLDRVLADARFAQAERNARFLRYLVEKALAGRADEIKEIIIAAEFYGRPSDYDPKVDSLVRVEASRLRTRLENYYQNEGARDPIRIVIPRGSYVPRFESLTPAEPARAERKGWLAGGLIALLALSLYLYARTGDGDAELAWQEGVELLAQDPHSGVSEQGPPATLLRAIARFEYSVARDPLFARGWASLSEAYEYASAYVGRDWAADAKRAESAALRATALDPNLAQAHAAAAMVQFYLRWNLGAAERSYRRALELDPRHAWAAVEYADLLRIQGRTQQAVELIRRTRALLPAAPALAAKEAEIQVEIGQTEAASLTAAEAVRLNQDYRRTHLVAGLAWEAKGDFARALEAYRRALDRNPRDRHALPAAGYLLARLNRREEAIRILRQLERLHANVRNSAYQIAVVHAGLGDKQQSLDWLERGYRTHQAYMPHVRIERRFESLSGEPRFRKLAAGFRP